MTDMSHNGSRDFFCGGEGKTGCQEMDWHRLQNLCQTCPFHSHLETELAPSMPEQAFIASLARRENVIKLMEERAGKEGTAILPVLQNLEAVVLGTRLQKKHGKEGYFDFSSYCAEDPEELLEIEFDLIKDPMIQAVIQTIGAYTEKPLTLELTLEVEAPFSILSALINPMKLYQCSGEKEAVLREVLQKIGDASAAYIRECAKMGCRSIRLADPAGSIELVGPDYYRRITGWSQLYLIEACSPLPAHAAFHICPKMSLALSQFHPRQMTPSEE